VGMWIHYSNYPPEWHSQMPLMHNTPAISYSSSSLPLSPAFLSTVPEQRPLIPSVGGYNTLTEKERGERECRCEGLRSHIHKHTRGACTHAWCARAIARRCIHVHLTTLSHACTGLGKKLVDIVERRI